MALIPVSSFPKCVFVLSSGLNERDRREFAAIF